MTHPPIEPFRHGWLAVGDGNEIYWELSGNPNGKPLIYFHGGPGSGLGSGGYRRNADPALHLIVGLDQRGCGRSRPSVIDDLDRLPRNITAALIDDAEAVRIFLGIDRWLVTGVSWGSTLALAYAHTHPERVTEVVLVAVTTTSRDEVDWITEGVGRVFPEAWARFEAASGRHSGERVVEAFARRLASGDAEDRAQAADDWDDWESAHMSLNTWLGPGRLHDDATERATFATLVTHYWSHDAFLPGSEEILAHVDRIKHIPAVLIHGRLDISGPVITAWRLHQLWPASRLHVVEHEGHGGPDSMAEMCRSIDAFATDQA